MRRIVFYFACCIPALCTAAEFHVSSTGKADGTGALTQPWDLTNAFSPHPAVKPGDTVWLHAGEYVGNFVTLLTGTSDAWITVRGWPGDRVIISGPPDDDKGYPITIKGRWASYQDFEVIHPATWRPNALTPVAVQCSAPDTKLVNLIIHDSGQGVGSWMEAANSEIYGCLIFNNGARALEHGIYTQNSISNGVKRIHDNIIFNNAGFGVHAYTQHGQLTGFDFQGNVLFNNGAKHGDDTRYDNLFVGGEPPADHIHVVSNYTYFSPGVSRPNFRFSSGDHSARPHGNLLVADNYLISGIGFTANDWKRITFTNNTLLNWAARFTQCQPPPGVSWNSYQWDFNRYYGMNVFATGTNLVTFAGWRKLSGLDSHSVQMTNWPSAPHVVVRPNRYQPRRAHVVVYNWDDRDRVAVDLRGILNRGDRFEVRNAQDFFARAVLTGAYQGGTIQLPLTNLTVAQPMAQTVNLQPTGKAFNVFVVQGEPQR